MYPIYHLQYMYSTYTVYYTRPERRRHEGRRRKCKRLTILPITKYSLILNLFLIFSLCLNLSTVLYPHLWWPCFVAHLRCSEASRCLVTPNTCPPAAAAVSGWKSRLLLASILNENWKSRLALIWELFANSKLGNEEYVPSPHWVGSKCQMYKAKRSHKLLVLHKYVKACHTFKT